MRTLTGHSSAVTAVAFTDDGAQVVSGSGDRSMRWWDVASGRQVRQLAGDEFAWVEGPSGEQTTERHVITTSGDTLRIYECAEAQQHAEGGATAVPVACFKALQHIFSVRCFSQRSAWGATTGRCAFCRRRSSLPRSVSLGADRNTHELRDKCRIPVVERRRIFIGK